MADEELALEEEQEEGEEESSQRGGKKKKTAKKKAAKKKAAKKKVTKKAAKGGGEEDEQQKAELNDNLKKKGKWMYCTVVMAGTNVIFSLDPKKPITKDKQNTMKGTMKGKKTVYIGACKTGNPLKFRLVPPKKGAKLPPPMRKYLKSWVNQQTGKNIKIELGDPLEEMPKKLSEIDEMDKKAKK